MSLAVLCTFLQPCVVFELVSATSGASELWGHCLNFFLFFLFFFSSFFFLYVWEVEAAGSLSLKHLWELWCGGNCLVQPEQFTQCVGPIWVHFQHGPHWVHSQHV